jgi:hypothetical protein
MPNGATRVRIQEKTFHVSGFHDGRIYRALKKVKAIAVQGRRRGKRGQMSFQFFNIRLL